MNKKSLIFLTIILISFSSCSIFKNSRGDNVEKNQKTLSGKVLDTVKNKALDYNTLYIKYQAKYASADQNFSFSGNIRILHDQAILVTLSPGFGIELGRLLVTQDSVKFYNVLKNSYIAEKNTFFLDTYGFDLQFSTLENMLTAQFFTYPASIKESDYKLISDSAFYKYKFEEKNLRNHELTALTHQTDIKKQDHTIREQKVEDFVSFRKLNIFYNEFLLINSALFPEKIEILLEEKTQHQISFNYKKILVNKEFTPKLKIPKNAKKIE